MQLLVRNKVKDFARWRTHFDHDSAAAAQYGLKLAHMWQAVDDPNNVYFLLDVESIERSDAFMARPESREVGEKAGVLDGDYHYLTPVRQAITGPP